MHEQVEMPDGWLYFNQQPLRCRPGMTLDELLSRQGLASGEVATAVNGRFVPRAQRSTTRLRVGDQILTFQAIVGG